MIGNHLSHYLIESELGRGGMGIVYRARDTKLDRTVAIKVLPSAALASDDDRARFHREAKAAAQLHHPHIASVFEIDEAVPEGAPHDAQASPFIAMEFIEGETLDDRIKAGPLKLAEAIRIATEIASGLQEAHEKEIVHRDVKASNVMLTSKGTAKILDFGLAQTAHSTKLTRMGSTLGTVAYMSPEQARGEEVDARSDIWSLGAVIYEMVSGRSAFPGDYEQAVVYEILNQDPEPLTAVRTGVPMELERIVEKCLAKDAARRYQHADDLIADLKGVDAASIKQSSQSRTIIAEPAKPVVRTNWIVVLGAMLLAAGATWLLTRPGDSTNNIQVTGLERVTISNAQEIGPAIHPSGDRIVYTVEDSTYRTSLYYRSTTGGTPQKLTSADRGGDIRFEHDAAYSPDGSSILYTSSHSIQRVDALGGVPSPVAIGAEGAFLIFPDWDPIAPRFAYVSSRFSGADSLMIQEFGASEPEIAVAISEVHSLAWSPNGEYIAFVKGNVVNAVSNYNHAPSNIWLYRLSDGEQLQITTGNSMNYSPVWEPDGSALYFVSDRYGGQDIYRVALNTSGAVQEEPARLTVGMSIQSMDISEDGSRLVVGTRITSVNAWEGNILPDRPISAAEMKAVTEGEQVIEGSALSVDGLHIAYDSDIRGGRHTFIQPLSGGTPAQITNLGMADYVNDWSPYSDEVAFHTYPGGIREPRIVSLSTREETVLSETDLNERNPIWLWDKDTMAFSRENLEMSTYELVISTRDASGAWNTGDAIVGAHEFGSARWLKEANLLVFIADDGMLYSWSRSDTEPSLLLDPDQLELNGLEPTGVSLVSDDAQVAYVEADSGDQLVYFEVQVDSKSARKIMTLPAGSVGVNVPMFRGDLVLVTLLDVKSDVWLLQLSVD